VSFMPCLRLNHAAGERPVNQQAVDAGRLQERFSAAVNSLAAPGRRFFH
jgi:hypothetical protein